MAHAAGAGVTQIVSDGLHRSWVVAPRATYERVLQPGRIEERYDAAQAAIRANPDRPQVVGGTYDLYTSELSYLFAQGADWSPRPSLQSRTAYTPELARLDRNRLLAPDRPDHLFVRFDLRDGLWAPTGDGASWLAMAQWYDYGGVTGDFIRLDARTDPRSIEYGDPVVVHGAQAEPMTLNNPTGWDGLVATVEIEPTLRGRVLTTALRSSSVAIQEKLDDGTTFRKRLLPQLGSVEVVVSPHINSASALAALIDPSQAPHPLRRTTSLRITPDTPADWQDAVTVTYRPFRITG